MTLIISGTKLIANKGLVFKLNPPGRCESIKQTLLPNSVNSSYLAKYRTDQKPTIQSSNDQDDDDDESCCSNIKLCSSTLLHLPGSVLSPRATWYPFSNKRLFIHPFHIYKIPVVHQQQQQKETLETFYSVIHRINGGNNRDNDQPTEQLQFIKPFLALGIHLVALLFIPSRA